MNKCYRLSKTPRKNAVAVGESGYIYEDKCTKEEDVYLYGFSLYIFMKYRLNVTCTPQGGEKQQIAECGFPVRLASNAFVLDDEGKCAGVFVNEMFFTREEMLEKTVEVNDSNEYEWGSVEYTAEYDFESTIRDASTKDMEKMLDHNFSAA